MSDFTLHQRLDADTFVVADLKLCRALLMNDARYPWVILVPRIPNLREVHNLSHADQHQLMDETSQVAQALEQEFDADKMNVAALGNMVPQLHIHVVARNTGDAAWPGPVWGVGDAKPYSNAEAIALCQRIRVLLNI